MNSDYQNISLLFYFWFASVLQLLSSQVDKSSLHQQYSHLFLSLIAVLEKLSCLCYGCGSWLLHCTKIPQNICFLIQQQYSSSSLSTLSLNWDVRDQPQCAFHAWIDVFEWKCQVLEKFSNFLIKSSRPIMTENNLNIEICQK